MIENAKIEIIRSWKKDENGWFVSPLGDQVKLGDGVMIGNGATIRDRAKIGDGATSKQLNQMFKKNLMLQGLVLIFTKWVTPDRMSPNFDGGRPLKYEKNTVLEVAEAQESDQQCAPGLHILRRGYRPEWAGLCEADHNLIPLDVEVAVENILFAGLPGNDAKLRVRKLKVLT